MGLDKNNDPIQDYNPGALKMKEMYENLTGDEDYSGRDEDYREEYHPDLHDCSDDLSEEGSIREEREHAKYAYKAKQKKIDELNGQGYYGNKYGNKYGNRYGTGNKYGTVRRAANKATTSVVGIYAFLIIFIVIAGMIMSAVLGEKTVYNSGSETDDYDYDYDYNYDYNYDYTTEGSSSIENIFTWSDSYRSSNNTVQIYVQNFNEVSIVDVSVQVTFYDSDYNTMYNQVVFFDEILSGELVSKGLDCPNNFEGCYCEVLDYAE